MPLVDGIKIPLLKGVGLLGLRAVRSLGSKDLFLLLLPVFLVSLVILFPRENVFSVKANTNIVALHLTQSPLNQWDISSATLITDPFEPAPVIMDSIDAFIMFNDGVKAQVTMSGENLFVILNHEHSVGSVNSSSLVKKLGDYAELSIPVKDQHLFPFQAAVVLGEDVSVGVSHILHDANITVVEQQLFQNDRYLAGDYQLEMGDKLEFFADSAKKQRSVSKGFIAVSKDNLIEVVSHTVAKLARVERLGSSGYDIKANIWARLMYDPVIAAITTLMATLFLTLEFFMIIRKLITGKE